MKRRQRRAVAGVLVSGLVAGMMVPGPPAQARAQDLPGVPWRTCLEVIGVPLKPDRADCAVLSVPRDHSRPGNGSVGIRMLRRKATDPDRRLGVLFVNPGGPGASGLHFAYRAERFLAPDVAVRYDIIGFDPRGVGLSDPVRCFRTGEEHDETFARRLSVPLSATEVTGTMQALRTYTRLCDRQGGDLLPHVSTVDVARDLDLMRAALGEDRIGYVGFSYGTLLGATYANLYPDRVRAMVLDGNVDPDLRTWDGLEYDRQRAAGFESVLAAFLHRCAEAGTRCPFAGDDLPGRMALLRSRLRSGAVALPGGEVTLSTFTARLVDGLSSADRLPELARSLAELYAAVVGVPADAARRPGGPVNWFLRPIGTAGQESATPYRWDDSEDAVNCLDKPYPPAPTAVPSTARRWERQFPTFGRMQAFEGAVCATWPVRWWQASRYRGPWNRMTATAVLVVGNHHDPVTQFEFSRRMAAQLGPSRLVAVDMFGHGSLGLNDCADSVVAGYLLAGELPAAGLVCPADRPEFPPPSG